MRAKQPLWNCVNGFAGHAGKATIMAVWPPITVEEITYQTLGNYPPVNVYLSNAGSAGKASIMATCGRQLQFTSGFMGINRPQI